MKVLKSILNFYINSSIHVALSVYALTWITLLEYDLGYDKSSLYLVFFATISGYNFVKYFGLVKFHHRRLANWLKVIQIFSFLSFLAMCYYLLQINTKGLVLLCILACITFLYAIPLLPKKIFLDNQKNLRQISGLKIYIIALVWACSTVLLPVFSTGIEVSTDIVITTIQRFLYVMVLMLPFEIRDLNYDSLKLATIPQRIGIKKTKAIGALVLIVFFILQFLKDEMDTSYLISVLVTTFITLLFVIFSNKNQSKYYSAFWVESLPIVWLLLLLVLD